LGLGPEKEREMRKLYRVLIVGLALAGMVATAAGCPGGNDNDAGSDTGATE